MVFANTEWRKALLILIAGCSMTGSALAQPASSSPTKNKPPLSLHIRISRTVKSDQIPLEVTLKNISSHDVSLGVAFEPPPWAVIYSLDVRNGEGRQVKERPIMEKNRWWTTSGPLFELRPGQAFHDQLLVNRLFDLDQPGKYTIAAKWGNSNGHQIVSSNRITVTVRSPGHRKPHSQQLSEPALQPPFSITIKNQTAGAPVRLEIILTNTSKEVLDPEYSWSARAFDYEVEVRDRRGTLVATVKAQPYESRQANGTTIPYGGSSYFGNNLKPGEAVQDRVFVYASNQQIPPGEYSLQVLRRWQGQTIRSNTVETVWPAIR
jgi:hypothetical protein